MADNGQPRIDFMGRGKLSAQPVGVIILEPSGAFGVMFEPSIIRQLTEEGCKSIGNMVYDYLLRAKGLR